MKLRNYTILLLVGLFAGITASAQTTITEAQNGKTITIKKGAGFSVLFKKECIGCQYSWENNLIDSTKIKFVKSTYANGPKPGLAGGSQDHRFHFKALAAGRTKLSFANGDKNFWVMIRVK